MGIEIGAIGAFIALVVGLFFRGSYHKGKAKKENKRAEQFRKESTMLNEKVLSMSRQQKIKGEAHEKEHDIRGGSVSKRVDLGVSDSTTRNSGDET